MDPHLGPWTADAVIAGERHAAADSPTPSRKEIVEVRTSRGMSRAMLFSQAILLAEWEANAPLREGDGN
jgi:hypothetical protein